MKDEFKKHEILDRLDIIQQIFDMYITENMYLEEDEYNNACKISDSIAKLYQMVGARCV